MDRRGHWSAREAGARRPGPHPARRPVPAPPVTSRIPAGTDELDRLLFQHHPQPIWILDRKTLAFLAVNEAATARYGFTADEFLRITVADLDPREEEAEPHETIEMMLRAPATGSRGSTGVSRHRRKDGSVIDVEIAWSPITFQRRDALLAVTHDVTERRKVEEELQRSERRFATLFRSCPAAIGMGAARSGRLIDVNDRWLELYGYAREEVICNTINELDIWVDPVARGEAARILRETGSIRNFEARFRRKSGEVRDVLMTVEPVDMPDEGEPVLVAMLIDITERKRAEAERARLLDSERQARAEAERALERLRAIQNVSDAPLAHLVLDDLLKELLARLRGALAVDSATVLLLSEDRSHLTVRASQWLEDEAISEAPVPIGRGLAGRIAASRAPLVVEDLSTADVAPSPIRQRGRSFMGVPLLVEGEVIGVVNVVTRQARRFTEEDVRLLQLVADRVAPAIDRARLYEELRAGGRRLEALSSRLVQLQEAERRGLARELHDEIGQSLTGLKLMIERGARARHAGDDRGSGPVQDDSNEALTLVNDLMTRVRDLSMNLRPAMLDDLGLLPALFWHLERYSTQTGVRVDFRHSGLDGRLPPQVETAAFRIVQEALTNVARHAAAPEARVRVRVERRMLHLRIEDDGRGFDPERAMSGPSSGLTGMRERARLLKGRLSIETSPGSGTRLAADLPLADGADAGSEP